MQQKTKNKLIISGGIIAVIALILYLRHKNQPQNNEVPQIAQSYPGSNFFVPFYSNTPGISDNPLILYGPKQEPFQSTINVNANPNLFNSLSQKFIPLYGFVGAMAA